MKKAGLVLLGMALGIAICVAANSAQKEREERVLNGRNATIYYSDKDNGLFDIVVEPKNGMRVTTEAPMTVGKYYDGAYMTGITKKKAAEIGIEYK